MKKRILSLCMVVLMICTPLFASVGPVMKAEAAEYNEMEITGFNKLDGTSLNAVYLTTSNITFGPNVGSVPSSSDVYGNWETNFSGTVEFRLRDGTKKEVVVTGFSIVSGGLYVNWTQQEPASQVTIDQVARITIKEGTILTDNAGEKTSIKITKTLSLLKLDENIASNDGYEVVPAEDETLLEGKTGKAKVILLSGQSNATGTSSIAYLKSTAASEDYARYKAGYENVLIRYEVDSDNDTANPNIRLNASSTFVPVALGQGGRSNYFGPEIGIADYLTENYPNETFYIIKSSWSGTYLGTDWQEGGKAYEAFVERTNESFQILEDNGLEPELFAFCWMQGEADAGQQALANAYYDNLSDFVTRVSTLYGDYIPSSGMAFVDAGISDMSSWVYHETVNAAKEQYAKEADNRYYLDTQAEGLTYDQENNDLAHYDSLSMIRLGEMFGEATAKWLYGPKTAALKTGNIDTSHGTGKYLVYFSNTAELAENCSWYSGIYNGTNKASAYLTGKVQVGGENYTAQIWVPGDQGTSGLIRFDVNTTSDFVIPAGTIFTYTNDTSQQIVFDKEYLFDMSLGVVYPTEMSTDKMNLACYSWKDSNTLGFTIGNKTALSEELQAVFSLTAVNDCPTYKGEVQVTTSAGTETKVIEARVIFNGELWFYIGNAGITTGTITILKDTVFVPNGGTTAITFPRTYTMDLDNVKLTHEQETLEFNAFSWTNSSTHVGVTVASQDEMKNVGWYTIGAGTNDNTYYTAYGNVVNESGETKQMPIKIAPNGELFLMINGVASETITISKDTVFQSTGTTYPTKTVFSFKFASDYVVDITNKTVIHQETLSLGGYNWKNKDLMNVENGASSFNELEWYEKNYSKAADRDVIKAIGVAKDVAGNDVSLTIQIQDQGLITCWYANVGDTRITIPVGTVFKTTSVATAAGTSVKKQYWFTFDEACELDAATKYVGSANGQTGKAGDANIDNATDVRDLVCMKKFVAEMGDSTVTSIASWKIGYGADVNADGSYDAGDLQSLRTLLVSN